MHVEVFATGPYYNIRKMGILDVEYNRVPASSDVFVRVGELEGSVECFSLMRFLGAVMTDEMHKYVAKPHQVNFLRRHELDYPPSPSLKKMGEVIERCLGAGCTVFLHPHELQKKRL